MPHVPDMFNIEWLEALLATLALMSAAVSVHLWHRAAAVPNMPDQPSLTMSWRARLHARAGSAAAAKLDYPRYATVEEAKAAISELRKVDFSRYATKKEAEDAFRELRRVKPQPRYAPREEAKDYLLITRQLRADLRLDLLPHEANHPTLWIELRGLRDDLQRLI